MEPRYTYLLVDLFCIFFPLLFSFFPAFNFYKTWKSFVPAVVITTLFFILWDALFTHLAVWSFNPKYTLPYRFMGLPLEEILFFVCIPYACVFTYFCVKKYVKFKASETLLRRAVFAGITVLLLVAIFNAPKWYTSVTFVLLAGFLFFLVSKNVKFLDVFFLSFILILPFFFLSNGILTGSFIAEPVVLYNSKYNLGIRMFTIPFEDTFYGMLLLLMNVSLYEYFGRKIKDF